MYDTHDAIWQIRQKNTSSTDPDISNGDNNDDDETGGNLDDGTSDDSNVDDGTSDDGNSEDVSNNIKSKPLKQWSKKRRESDRKTDALTRRKRQDW